MSFISFSVSFTIQVLYLLYKYFHFWFATFECWPHQLNQPSQIHICTKPQWFSSFKFLIYRKNWIRIHVYSMSTLLILPVQDILVLHFVLVSREWFHHILLNSKYTVYVSIVAMQLNVQRFHFVRIRKKK